MTKCPYISRGLNSEKALKVFKWCKNKTILDIGSSTGDLQMYFHGVASSKGD